MVLIEHEDEWQIEFELVRTLILHHSQVSKDLNLFLKPQRAPFCHKYLVSYPKQWP